ncbi:hypothetical protein ABPG72_018365 [Tetrahymena utriculariae]
MEDRYQELIDEIELKQTARQVTWRSFRRTSTLICPNLEYLHHELGLQEGRTFSFRPQNSYTIYLRLHTVKDCEKMLKSIMEQQNILIFENFPRAPLQKLKKTFQKQVAFQHASDLMRQGVLGKFIQAQTGLSKSELGALRSRITFQQNVFPRNKGRRGAMTEEQFQWLKGAMERQELIGKTAQEIRALLAQRFGPQAPSVRRSQFTSILRQKLRWSYSFPVSQKDKTNDEETINKRMIYAQKLIPQLEKGRNIIYIDETGFQLRNIPRKTWQRRGRKFVVREQAQTKNYTLIGALEENSFIGYMIVEKGAKQEQFMGFMSLLIKNLLNRGDLQNCLFVFDNARIHYSNLMREYLLKYIPHLFLAPYSPQLNPIEKLWALLKSKLSKRSVRDLPSLLRNLLACSQSIAPSDIQKIFRYTTLFYVHCLNKNPLNERPLHQNHKVVFNL